MDAHSGEQTMPKTMSYQVYWAGSWIVVCFVSPDGGDRTYQIYDALYHLNPIKARDLKAAIHIADCLAENAV
jgi:hypothetical protein